ncbi:alpha/beta hydrolase family protein [Planktotalea sp.]|uniref:alpha/beta hydrolase family protein n=1 Tax=Planktotalea sp. TaxID=2029877 RepID=UPI003F6CB255
MKHAIAAAAVALTVGPVMAENRIDTIRPDAPALAAYGEYVVGVRTFELSNPGQIDIVNTTADNAPTYDRPLTVEVWYPAADGVEAGGTYEGVNLRAASVQVALEGQAVRDAAPAAEGSFPLIVISHGYPGNRFLMSHLGENLASKGYVTVSIDHTDSTYADQNAFGSTLLNRPLDQDFVVETFSDFSSVSAELAAIIDGDTVGVIGYSMGGYGALIYGGAGVTQASTEYPWGTPNGLLTRHLEGSQSHASMPNDKVKAIISIAPWGKNTGFWSADGLAGFSKPLMLMAGSVDDVSAYSALRSIFTETTGTKRHLLTFENANHNAAAPMPSPKEGYQMVEGMDFAPFEHYADAVWDNTRMNNIAQHFATAFMDMHLKGDDSKAAYLDLIENAAEGVTALDDAGKQTDAHTYWEGFPARTAAGLKFETLDAGN